MSRAGLRELAVRFDAAGTDIDADDSCTCSCAVTRGRDGRLVRDPSACSCSRVTGVRIDQHGDPKVTLEPCKPDVPRASRTDAKRSVGAASGGLGSLVGPVDLASRSVRVVAATPGITFEGHPVERWDLTRFLKNPVILFAHDSDALPIGVAKDVRVERDNSLLMTIVLGSAEANPRSEEVLRSMHEGTLRGVSVGFSWLNGEPGIAELIEVSAVPIPMDEDALVENARSREDDDDCDCDEDDDDCLEECEEEWSMRSDSNDDALVTMVERARAARDALARDAWKLDATPTPRSAATRLDAIDPMDVEAARKRRDMIVANAWRT